MDMSFFGEMAWKSALISGAALALAYVLRSRAAADRAVVLRLGVGMLLLLPVISLALPALRIEAWRAPAATAPAPVQASRRAFVPAPMDLGTLALPELAPAAAFPAEPGRQPGPPTIWDDPTPLVLLAYLGGLAMAGARLLAGLVLLRRWTRAGREVECPHWRAALAAARPATASGERLRLLASDRVPSPLSWGWRNPVVLIDPDTLAEPDQAVAILAHEIAHVSRRDWPVLVLTRLAAALFWFNPLVWLLEREVVQQAEEAADCAAASCVEPTRYARTLLNLAQVNGRLIPANSIAPNDSALARRVRAILDRRLRERPSGSARTAIAAIACVAIAAPVAAMQLVAAAQSPAQAVPTTPRTPATPMAPEAQAPEAPTPPESPVVPQPPLAPTPPLDAADAAALAQAGPAVRQALAETLPRIPQIVAEAMASVDAVNPAEIQRTVDEALAKADQETGRLSHGDRELVGREVRRAMENARAQIGRVERPQIELAIRQAHRAAFDAQAVAARAMATSMAHGAEGMAHGAEGMEAGARTMEQNAARFRDRDYRAQIIAREAARGHTVTDQDLLEAARGLEEGARGMREGARAMREAGRHMATSESD